MARTKKHSHNWKGGRTVDPRGYVLIYVGKDHHLADVRGYAYEHRLVAEKKIGRRLRKGEEVHHKKGRSDNNPSDIEVAPSRAAHRALHRKRTDLREPGARNPYIKCACGCGDQILKFDASNRPRRFISGHNMRGKC